jgi:hypothetical protein
MSAAPVTTPVSNTRQDNATTTSRPMPHLRPRENYPLRGNSEHAHDISNDDFGRDRGGTIVGSSADDS